MWQKVKLEACMLAIYDDKFNCGKCIASQPDPKSLAILQDKKACHKLTDYHVADSNLGWRLHRCPGRLYGGFETDLVRDYQRLRDYNLLPLPGSMGDQPAWWPDAMDFIRDQEQDYQREETKRREMKAKRNG